MAIDTKTELDALENLRNGAWEDFNNRRMYEWKMSLGIWTAAASFIAFMLAGHGHLSSDCRNVVLATVVMISIWCLHAYFISKLTRSNRIDREKQFYYEERIKKILEVEFDEKLQRKIAIRQEERERPPLLDWSQAVQMLVTTILLLVALSVIFGLFDRRP